LGFSHRAPLSPISLRNAVVFLPGVAELYTPAKPCPGSSQKDGAGCLLYAWPDSPFGSLRAQRLTLPGTPLHIVELLLASQLAAGSAAAA